MSSTHEGVGLDESRERMGDPFLALPFDFGLELAGAPTASNSASNSAIM